MPTRYARLGAEHPRRRQWWYIKERMNPTGKRGRPPTTTPIEDRRRKARQQYQANLARRGQRILRLVVPTAVADRFADLAKARGLSPGQLLEDLLSSPSDRP